MPNILDSLIARIRSIGDEYCENQMSVWPGFNPTDCDPEEFFRERGIEFDGLLFIRYPVKTTFNPIPIARIEDEERSLGVTLPSDYKVLLQQFGEFHLPGNASIRIESPLEALRTTRWAWCYGDRPLSALAISSYDATSDGNSIGFVRNGDSFQREIYEFNHELVYQGDSPSLWTKKISNCLAEFLFDYLDDNL